MPAERHDAPAGDRGDVPGDVAGGVLELLPTRRIRYGPGSVASLPGALEAAGVERAFIMTTRSLRREGALLARVEQAAGSRLAGRAGDLPAHVPAQAVRRAAEAAGSAAADGLISFGGGSVIDMTKAVAAVLADARGTRVPHIAVPTTLSGAELADHYGITEIRDGQPVKLTHVREDVTPVEVILDAALTSATPDSLWAGTAVKAMDHAIEGLLCRTGPRPLLDELAQTGLRALAQSLEASLPSSGGGLEARQRCQIAAWHCYAAPASLVLGLSHRIGHVLGGTFGVPHAVTSAITLPAVMRAMQDTAAVPLRVVARALDTATPLDLAADANGDPSEAAELLSKLTGRLGLPRRLREVGLRRPDTDTVARIVAERFPASLGQIGPAAEGRLRELLRLLW